MRKNIKTSIKDIISLIIFSYALVHTHLYVKDVNQYFLMFIIIGLMFFIGCTILDIKKIIPDIKNREKIGVSDSFIGWYFLYINSIIGVGLSILLFVTRISIQDYDFYLSIFGFGVWSNILLFTFLNCMRYKTDMDKIDNVVKKWIYKNLLKTD